MSHPHTPPPEDPYGQYPQQGGQGHTGGGPAPGPYGHPGGHPAPDARQYGVNPAPDGYQDQTGGYQAAGYPQGGQQGYGHPQGGYGPRPAGSATGAPPSQDERQFGLFAHLGGGLFGFIVPLIIYLVKRDDSPFLRDQAGQALNFQLLVLIGYVVSSVLSIILIGALLWFLVFAASVIFGILGGIAANKGERYRYPFNVSWIK